MAFTIQNFDKYVNRTIVERGVKYFKRDLADSLLSGADVSVRLSADELLDLIKRK